jgi:hypothetical protein
VPGPPDEAIPSPSPSDLGFGEVTLLTSRELTLNVTNLGEKMFGSVLRIEPAAAPFSVSPSDLELDAQESATLVVSFAPLQLGAANAQLIIPGENPAEVQLSGEGVAPEPTLAPTTTTCTAATAVGAACQVTLSLSANPLAFVGFSLEWQARRYRLLSVEAAALTTGRSCLLTGGPQIIAGACSDSVTGNGAFVRLNFERSEAGPNRLVISDVELFTEANAVHPIAGGSLDLP